MIKAKNTYPEHYRWNFAMGIVHGISFSFAMAFSEPFSILPVFLESFGISRLTIGLLISIIKAGSALPQIFVANSLQTKKIGKPILFAAIWTRWFAWGIVSVSVFLWGSSSLSMVLFIFILMLFIYSFAGGVANVPFFNMIAKAIPPEKRGTFFGIRQFLGGLSAIGAGFLVRIILSIPELKFPINYGYLFLATFALLTFGYLALSLFREPEHIINTTRQKAKINLKTAFKYMSLYPSLRRVIFSQIASQGLFISMPFFILYAKQSLGFPASWVGYFVIARMAGGIISNFLWAGLSNRLGNRIVIRLSSLSALISLIIAMTGHSIILFLLVFVLIGFYYNGSSMGYNNYIMELGDSIERPRLISIQGTMLFPIYFFPLLGGFLLDHIGFIPTFTITSLLLLTSFILSFGLCEPRKGQKSCLVIPDQSIEI
ncbi:MFS transporter [bacterium]|nr:MFS transporter [bacterium]